ncbi:MAG: pyruvate formate lyase family protein, partial [Clostridia bacterium]|nr:pyruvate formate lyase family protein [Clostridia bacterium]
MEFYTISKEARPVRLSEATRRFAYESLNHRWGLDTRKTPAVELDDIPGWDAMTPLERHDAAIRRIAERAPVRICEGERISGAATLGLAISHQIPATYGGKAVFGSVSHLTIDFPSVLRRGVKALYDDIEASAAAHSEPEAQAFLASCRACLDAFRLWHGRYLDALKGREGYEAVYEALLRVPFEPARSFREAVQSLWFTFAFVRLCGNWPGIGRIDEMFGDYLARDLASGALTLDEAREILAHFFIKGCEWVSGGNYGSGDAQHYQNIVLAGIGVDGREVTNNVTYLVLDILDELGISDFPTTIRVNEATDDRLLDRAARTVRYGGGIVAFYNEPLILQSLMNFGYSEREARQFANDGCWEIQIPGKTHFSYTPFDSLQILLRDTLRLHTDAPANFDCFEDLYAAFRENLDAKVKSIYANTVRSRTGREPGMDWVWGGSRPCSVVSLFEQGCIESGRAYLNGGACYTVVSPHIGGAPDVGNSLYAIDRLVFRDKKISFAGLMELLQNDWEGNEILRQYVGSKLVYYGNDCDESDAYTVRVLDDFSALVAAADTDKAVRMPAGVSTFGRQIDWAPVRGAVPFGKKTGDILS